MDSALPEYVMLSAKQMTNSLAALGPQALTELRALQASIQQCYRNPPASAAFVTTTFSENLIQYIPLVLINR